MIEIPSYAVVVVCLSVYFYSIKGSEPAEVKSQSPGLTNIYYLDGLVPPPPSPFSPSRASARLLHARYSLVQHSEQ